MSGINSDKVSNIEVEEISDNSPEDQRNFLADFFSSTRNTFEPITTQHISEIVQSHSHRELTATSSSGTVKQCLQHERFSLLAPLYPRVEFRIE